MKLLLNIFLFVAIFAFTAEVASVLWESSKVESLATADADEEDTDDPSDGNEEEEDFRAKEWFLTGIGSIELEWLGTGVRKDFADPGESPVLHLTDPPYSPPEHV